MHRVKNAPVYRLQAVADIRQRAHHDNAHRVIDVAGAHLFFNIHGYDGAVLPFCCHINPFLAKNRIYVDYSIFVRKKYFY